ncbi:unnamed protein product [Closterium sp. NIES-54]
MGSSPSSHHALDPDFEIDDIDVLDHDCPASNGGDRSGGYDSEDELLQPSGPADMSAFKCFVSENVSSNAGSNGRAAFASKAPAFAPSSSLQTASARFASVPRPTRGSHANRTAAFSRGAPPSKRAPPSKGARVFAPPATSKFETARFGSMAPSPSGATPFLSGAGTGGLDGRKSSGAIITGRSMDSLQAFSFSGLQKTVDMGSNAFASKAGVSVGGSVGGSGRKVSNGVRGDIGSGVGFQFIGGNNLGNKPGNNLGNGFVPITAAKSTAPSSSAFRSAVAPAVASERMERPAGAAAVAPPPPPPTAVPITAAAPLAGRPTTPANAAAAATAEGAATAERGATAAAGAAARRSAACFGMESEHDAMAAPTTAATIGAGRTAAGASAPGVTEVGMAVVGGLTGGSVFSPGGVSSEWESVGRDATTATMLESAVRRAKERNVGDVEEHSGIRLRNRFISAPQLRQKLADIRFLRLEAISSALIGGRSQLAGAWATIAVISGCSSVKATATAKPSAAAKPTAATKLSATVKATATATKPSSSRPFMSWKLSCLSGPLAGGRGGGGGGGGRGGKGGGGGQGGVEEVTLFLFGAAFDVCCKQEMGTVVAVLGAEASPPKGNLPPSLRVFRANQILPVGIARDFGICKGVTEGNEPCNSVINK